MANQGISAGDAVWTITGDTQPLEGALASAEGSVTGATERMSLSWQKVGIAVTAVGAAMTAALGKSVSDWAEMGDQIDELATQTGISTEAMSELGYIAGQAGSSMEGLAGSITKMNRNISEAKDGTTGATAALDALGISAAQFSEMSQADQIGFLAQKLNEAGAGALNTSLALDSMGLSFDKVAKASPSEQMTMIAKAAQELSSNTNPAALAIQRLGLNIDTLAQMNPEQQFIALAGALDGVQDHSLKTALAMDLFGRSGAELIPMLEMGSAGLEQERQKVRELGLSFSSEGAKGAGEFKDAMQNLSGSFDGIKNAIAPVIASVVKEWTPAIENVAVKTREWVQENPRLAEALFYVAVPLAGLMDVIGPLLIALPGLAMIFKSVTVAITAAGIGIGAAVAGLGLIIGTAIFMIVDNWKGIVEGLDVVWDAVVAAGEWVVDVLSQIWDAIVAVFEEGWNWIAGIIAQIGDAIGGLFGGIAGFFGGGSVPIEARASGGPVSGGMPYIVGEEGPELFVPSASGSIVPNGGGNSVTINLNNPVVRDDSDIRRISESLAGLVGRELRGMGAFA